MPGAFAYHLHSFSAQVLRTTTAGWVGPLLDRGAAATVGYVEEPYLQTTLDCQAFFARWVFGGFTLGEAVYAALPALSWQATVVGDPLYRPFGRLSSSEPIGRRFQELHQRLQAQTNALIEWSHLQVVNLGLNAGSGLTSQELVRYLEEQSAALRSAVLTEKLGNLFLAAGKFLLATKAYARALEYRPSPQQKIRLLLELASLDEASGEEAAALGLYETLLTGFPDYPDRLTVLRKAHSLARILQREEAAAKFQAEIRQLTPPTRR
jgi:tetratricopeptide (TPR) repeat protein